MQRSPHGKRTELTARDIEIFRLLGRYRYLRSTFIHAFVGGASVTRFKERLGHLFHEGYIARPEAQWNFADCRHVPAVYEIGVGARRALAHCGRDHNERVTWLGQHAHRQFTHAMMICEILASIELAVREHAQLRFVSWSEILSRAPDETKGSDHPFKFALPRCSVVPDALFGIEYLSDGKQVYRFFALEADRATMPITRLGRDQTSYLQKLLSYREIISQRMHRKRLGIPNLFVLTVTTSQPHQEHMLAAFQQSAGGSPLFLFQVFERAGSCIPSKGLVAQAWQRPAFPPTWLTDPT